ncbi:hypothetical protein [Niallia nealsonii]|uniref:Uncharacterized protein n=1 Tax=Niallia nealsonii TaxID=115979 RepID=A0A2N0Z457_9BACI|nr:hypothetical protein [Niallia nealsonii]PKG24274.1 hypothetical protein CWS01_07750 [Niallia nealsonii]
MKELRELQKAGYKFIIDGGNVSYQNPNRLNPLNADSFRNKLVHLKQQKHRVYKFLLKQKVPP